ncbi:hypothetical protein TNCV_507831 [Trichonephila clavipes]|nr:hypothetical protein TNCV_507831 [Trichonephila clavipes]
MHRRRFIRGSMMSYKTARRNEKIIHKKKKRENLLKDAEHLSGSNESQAIYKMINNSSKDFKFRVTFCRDNHGEILSDSSNISKRLIDYFSDLLNTNHPTCSIHETQQSPTCTQELPPTWAGGISPPFPFPPTRREDLQLLECHILH